MAKKRRKRRELVSDQLRAAINSCGMSRYAIWKATGIDQATLAKFVQGERGLSMTAIDALGELLELEVVMHLERDS